jgi:hypothetical protein
MPNWIVDAWSPDDDPSGGESTVEPIIERTSRDIIEAAFTPVEGRDIADELATTAIVVSCYGLDITAATLDDARDEIRKLRAEAGRLRNRIRDLESGGVV